MSNKVTASVENPELVEKRREQIVRAATKLFSSKGFNNTTIKELAAEAGISQGLVYLYVREKEDVLLLVLQQVVKEYAVEIPRSIAGVKDPLERLIRAIDAYCRVVDRHLAATMLAYQATKSLSLSRRNSIQESEMETNAIIGEIIRDCIGQGILRPVNVDILTYQIVFAAHGWALKGWYFKPRIGSDEYISDTIDIILNGLLTAEGQDLFDNLPDGLFSRN